MEKEKNEEVILTEHLLNAEAVQLFLENELGEDFDILSSTLVSDLYSTSLVVRHDIEKKVLNDENISWTGMLMMYTLWVWGESETKVIAKRLQLAPSSVTSLTNTLEKKGLVKRLYRPTDRRLVLVKLTKSGETLLKSISLEVNKRGKVLTNSLDVTEITLLNQLLKKLLISTRSQSETEK
jgi:DNA-binding MarR family transcriptional regulator